VNAKAFGSGTQARSSAAANPVRAGFATFASASLRRSRATTPVERPSNGLAAGAPTIQAIAAPQNTANAQLALRESDTARRIA